MIDTTTEQARFAGKILCYVAIHSPISRDDRFAIGIAVLGEAGYSLPSQLEFFTTYKEASIRAEELNKVFPYDADACVAIITKCRPSGATSKLRCGMSRSKRSAKSGSRAVTASGGASCSVAATSSPAAR